MPASVFEISGTHPRASAIDDAARVLAGGGLALFPTDTVYSIGSLARVGEGVSTGVDRLFAIKRRGRGPSFPWLVESVDDLDVYGMGVVDEARVLAREFWPGGLSIVVRASAAIPRVLAREDGTVALRVSASPVVAALLSVCRAPLVTTGANVHGAHPPKTFKQVDEGILSEVDIALSARGGRGAGPSTIIDCTARIPRILRVGVVGKESIDDVLGIDTELV